MGLVVVLPFMVFGLYVLIWTLRSSVIIDSTRIEVHGAFLERTAALSDIEGLRMISSRYGSHPQRQTHHRSVLSELVSHYLCRYQ